MKDNTENIRREMVQAINSNINPDKDQARLELETVYGKDNVWTLNELQTKFEIIGFMAPYCVVQDKQTGEKGSVMFAHSPRYYFNYKKD